MTKVVHVDMDDVLCDFKGAYLRDREQNPDIMYPQSVYGFFANLEPLAGALDAMFRLRNDNRFNVHILTAPSVNNPLCYTEKRVWVEEHLGFGFVEKLIICPNKGLVTGDYLIDDNAQGKGQDEFLGELILFGSGRFPNWEVILDYLEVK